MKLHVLASLARRLSANEIRERVGSVAMSTFITSGMSIVLKVVRVANPYDPSQSLYLLTMTWLELPFNSRNTNLATIARLAVSALVLFMLAMPGAEASTRNIGDSCSYKKNCQQSVDGAGPSWEKGRVTCAVPASQAPETCGSNEPNRSNFGG